MCKSVLRLVLFLFCCSGFAQEVFKADLDNYFKWRSNNLLELGAGIATPNVDFPDSEFGPYGTIGYKRVIIPQIRVGLSFNIFDLSAVKFEGNFMSFDFNSEFLMLPYNRFSPFINIGAGYNTTDDFENTSFKLHGGGGIELMVLRFLGVKVFTNYNYLLYDELENFEFGDSNDSYLTFGAGLNYYFGRTKKKKDLKGKKTIFNSNEIEQ